MINNTSCLLFLVTLFACGQAQKQISVAPTVTAVYPTLDTLPENVLRMYIQFSNPMKTQGNLENIKITSSDGVEVPNVIFNNVYELWDPDQKQLTILFDPARVKTGLAAHETLGRGIKRGRTYALKIDSLQDIYHNQMSQPFVKKFYVSVEDKQPPNPDFWDIKIPKSGSSDPMTITFQNTLDQQSLRQRLTIVEQGRSIVSGQLVVLAGEKSCQFIPAEPWQSNSYSLFIDKRLEDPAGNNVYHLFDAKASTIPDQIHSEVIERVISIE